MMLTRPRDTRPVGTAARKDSDTGPVKRVIAGSLGAGAVLVLVLTVGVAGGAQEHVITAMALLGAGGGWLSLAVLSTRLTDRPQRWAYVPAAVMSTTAVALLLWAPQGAALTAAGWAWPALLLVLTVWMARQGMRHLAGAQRWLLVPALVAMLLVSLGGAYATFALNGDSRTSAMPGRLYDVGGYRLHLDCTGTGSPTVVLLSGTGEMSPSWGHIAPALAATTRVCAYDRAGQGWSESSPDVADGTHTARDLHALLAAGGERGPFVLAGHSSGGIYALTFAADHPDEVAGMILLDSSSPRQLELVPSFAMTSEIMRRAVAVLPTLARTGLTQLTPSTSELPAPAAEQVASFAGSPRGLANVRDEQGALHVAMRQAQAVTTLDDRPLVVLTSQDELSRTPGWAAAQDRLAGLTSNSRHSVVDVTHAAMLDDPTSAATAARAIDDVVRSLRTRTQLPTTASPGST
jgi:pimeloyl-ACP methyl ester carboxylesterase